MTWMVFHEDDPTDVTPAIGAMRSMGGEGGTHPVYPDCQNWAKMTEEHFVLRNILYHFVLLWGV